MINNIAPNNFENIKNQIVKIDKQHIKPIAEFSYQNTSGSLHVLE